MAVCNLHYRKGNCGILCKCCSYKGIIITIIFYTKILEVNLFAFANANTQKLPIKHSTTCGSRIHMNCTIIYYVFWDFGKEI